MNIRKALITLPSLLILLLAGNAYAESSSAASWTEYTNPGNSISITSNSDNSGSSTSTVSFSAGVSDVWSYNGNIESQSSNNILSVIDTQFNLSATSLHSVGGCDSNCSNTFSSSSAFDYLAVHYGKGELLFQFAAPTTSFTISGLPNGLSNYRAYSDISISAVPEPESYGMLLAGLGLMGFMVHRKKNV